MNLHYHTVSKQLLGCLQKLMANAVFDDFVLVGGTALSLQLGHRISIDIDLFTANGYGSMNLEEIKNALTTDFPYTESLETLKDRNLGYTVYIGNNKAEKVKLDMFYTDDFIAPVVLQDGLRLASLQDIAAMKMQAIVNSKRKKDFWDIHEFLELFTLEELIQLGLQRNPYTLTESDILDSLCHSAELKQDSVIECLRGKYWELIIDDLQRTAKHFAKK
jgi:predicted nucleotidyltransferase component of viral defense system